MSRRSLEACGIAHDVLSADELSRVYPQIRRPERSLAVVQRDAGILDADRCVATLAEAARSRSVEIREGERVSAVEPRGSGAVLRTDKGSFDVDRVVIAAGPGMPSFLRELGIALDLIVSKEQAVYLEPADAEAFRPGRFPIVIRHFAEPRLSSVFPVFRAPGVKMMIEHKRAVADDEDFRVDDERAEEVRLAAVDLIPGLTGRICKVETCRYTLTGDEDFLLDVHPEHPQIVLASACSGHGFKFGPVLGEALADLAVDAPCRFDLGMFRLGRPALRQPAVQENQAPGAPQPESSDE